MTDTNNSPLEGNVLFYTNPEPLDQSVHGGLQPVVGAVDQPLVHHQAGGPGQHGRAERHQGGRGALLAIAEA